MSESAGIDSLGQEQSYSWGFLRRKNQPLAPQGLLSVFLYLAWPNMCLWALTVPWFLFINSFFLQAYEGLASLEPNLSTNLPQRTQSDTPLTVKKKVKSESHSVVSDSLQPHGLYSLWNFPRTLEWVAFPFSRVSSQPRDRTQVSCIAGRFFTKWTIREAFNSTTA